MKKQFTQEELDAWGNLTREDLRMIPTMVKNGFMVVFNKNDILHKRLSLQYIPNHPVSFTKDDVTVWETGNYTSLAVNMSWVCAKLINGYYSNHKKYNTLENFLTELNTQK